MHYCLGSAWRWLVGFLVAVCSALLPIAALAAHPPLAATATYTVNVPLLTAAAGDPAYDANNWSVLWFGKVSADGNNAGDLRLLGQTDGVAVRAQLYDVNATPGDMLTLELAGRTLRVPYAGTAGCRRLADRRALHEWHLPRLVRRRPYSLVRVRRPAPGRRHLVAARAV